MARKEPSDWPGTPSELLTTIDRKFPKDIRYSDPQTRIISVFYFCAFLSASNMPALAMPNCAGSILNFIKSVCKKRVLTVDSANQPSIQEPRKPPPPPTPLEFPRLDASGTENPPALQKDDIIKLFTSMPRYGPGTNYIDAINLQITHDVGLNQICPKGYLPPSSWLTEPAPAESSDTLITQDSNATSLSHSAVTRHHAQFHIRAKELLLNNEAAFAFLSRRPQPTPGPQVRIAYFRKFWDHLSSVADYWDASLDEYITEKVERESHRTSLRSISRSGLRNLSKSPFRKRSQSPKRRSSPSPEPSTRETYTGRRIGCGKDMPGLFREEAVGALVETVAWAFNCRVERPTTEPKLQIGALVLPIMHTASVYRIPKERQRARQGYLEGPLMAVQCRETLCFRRPDEEGGHSRGEVLDMLRETGLALMIAQRRMREGTTEKPPGEGKWWVKQKRWGGGTGKQISIVEATSMPKIVRPGDDVTRVADKYINLQPPSSTWERKVEYMQIGKDRLSQHDDIYLVSSLNHHVSILRFRISSQYANLIARDSSSTSSPSNAEDADLSGEPRYVLAVQRSLWYDLLKPEDRGEAVRGIWGVVSWLMRPDDHQNGGDVQMGGT